MNIEDTITRIFADHSVDAGLTSSQALSYIGSDYQTLTYLTRSQGSKCRWATFSKAKNIQKKITYVSFAIHLAPYSEADLVSCTQVQFRKNRRSQFEICQSFATCGAGVIFSFFLFCIVFRALPVTSGSSPFEEEKTGNILRFVVFKVLFVITKYGKYGINSMEKKWWMVIDH